MPVINEGFDDHQRKYGRSIRYQLLPASTSKSKRNTNRYKNGPMPEDYFDNYEMPGRKMNPYRGWEIYEKGIYDILTNVEIIMEISNALFLKMVWVSKMKHVLSKKMA